MTQRLIFHPVERQRPGDVEAERLQFAGDQLHDRHAALLDGVHEGVAGVERRLRPAPQAQTGGIGQVLGRGRTRGADIHHPGVGQPVLQGQARHPLLGGLLGSTSALAAARRVGHGVGFVKGDHPVEVGAQPADDLVEARKTLAPRRLTQGGVGGEQHPPVHADRVGLLPGALRGDVGGGAADRRPVPPGVLQQRVVPGDPHRLQATLGHVVGDDACGLATLAAAGAVAEEEAAAQLEGALGALLDQHQLVRRFAQPPPARQQPRLRLAGVDHGLDLGVGQQPLLHDVGRQERAIGRGRRRHRRHGAGFHQRGGVWTAPRHGQAADPVGPGRGRRRGLRPTRRLSRTPPARPQPGTPGGSREWPGRGRAAPGRRRWRPTGTGAAGRSGAGPARRSAWRYRPASRR